MQSRILVDLHAHYPMHVGTRERKGARAWMTETQRIGFAEKIRAWLLKLLNDHENYPAPNEPAVTVRHLKAGDVGVVLSVLYAPFDEMDLSKKYAAPPEPGYFKDLQTQIADVEQEVRNNYEDDAVVVHNHDELEKALSARKIALIHAIEGGFHLGDNETEIKKNVNTLRKAGVAYVTVAHLFFRQIATNAPAIPFLWDSVYKGLFPQPRGGLTDLGRAVIRALVKNHILIDLTHMSPDSLDATLDFLDENAEQNVPVVATHSAYRFGNLEYNLTKRHIQRIAKRKGVIGLIACDHYMTDGLRGNTKALKDSLEVFRQHINKIAELTNGYDCIGIGSDLDGFIKPSLNGLEFPEGFKEVRAYLAERYNDDIADKIFRRNAMRLLSYWRGA